MFLALFVMFGLACEEPPTVVDIPADPEPEPEPEPEPIPFVEHTVEPGQTLWDIARAYSVSVDAILEFNEMTERDVRRLRAGAAIRIPGATEAATVERVTAVDITTLPPLEDAGYHVIAEGETLWDIAQTYDLPSGEIMERNEFDDDAVRNLRAGSAIIIPGIEQSDVRVAEPSETRRVMHTVAEGETIWDLARSFRVSVSSLMAANRLDADSASNFRVGQRLVIPGGQRRSGDSAGRPLTRRQRGAQTLARRLGIGTLAVARKLMMGQVERRWVRAGRGRMNRMPGTLRWPVSNGRFVRGYGSGEGGYHLAVDIAGDLGWNVRSAAAGIVGYSGDEVPGYGNVVLVIHSGGWVTMYAHNSVNFVVAGERVPAGGVLAELGSTGISRGPHVHFEFIARGRNCDPASLFRPGVRHASRLAHIEAETWTRPDQRPEGVECGRRRRHPRSRWVTNE
ncbi:MAG: murein DD-endopeptidase MepM/ murein hydrolase activator NlpD [Polyangiales bacterium]